MVRQDVIAENRGSSVVTSTSTTLLSSLAVASTAAGSALMKSFGENFVQYIPAEVRKISVDHSTGETVLHKAARLGYLVTLCFSLYCPL